MQQACDLNATACGAAAFCAIDERAGCDNDVARAADMILCGNLPAVQIVL